MKRLTRLLPGLLAAICALLAQAPDRAAMDRYLEWFRVQPGGAAWTMEQRLEKYKTKLEAEGLSEAASQTALAGLKRQMLAEEAAMWDRIYSGDAPNYSDRPNRLLTEAVKGLLPRKALDVGMGAGRNAVYLAQQGWDVTGFDFSDQALALARARAQTAGVKIKTVLSNDEDFDFGRERWDLIAILYPAEKRSLARVKDALVPAGIVVVEGLYSPNGKRPAAFVSNELLKRFDGFRILRYEETDAVADWGLNETRLVRLIAQKPWR